MFLKVIVNEVTANHSEVVITSSGVPVAKIVPWQSASITKYYPLRGLPIRIADDFDEPIPDLWEALAQ